MAMGSFVGGVNGGEGVMVGEMKLPIGFRFRPTDEELVAHYLNRKALSLPLPASVILDFDVFFSDPWSLPGDLMEKRRYYFCRKGGESKCKNFTATGAGFWKTNGKCKQIVASSCDGSNQVVGTRKLWSFHQKNTQTGPHGGSRTPWVMHEFQLPRFTQNPDGQKQDWVVCRVFQRKRKPNKHGCVVSEPLNISRCCELGGFETPTYIDFKLEENNSDLGPPEPSSPCCSSEMVISNSRSSAEELAQEEQLTIQASFLIN